MTQYTDLRPRWMLLASNHVRGEKNTSVKATTIDELIDVSRHLKGYGYKTVKTYPINRGELE